MVEFRTRLQYAPGSVASAGPCCLGNQHLIATGTHSTAANSLTTIFAPPPSLWSSSSWHVAPALPMACLKPRRNVPNT